MFSKPNPKPNLRQYQKESPKLYFGLFIVILNTFGNSNIQQILFRAYNYITFNTYLTKDLAVHPSGTCMLTQTLTKKQTQTHKPEPNHKPEPELNHKSKS